MLAASGPDDPRTDEFDYELPPELIAQTPAEPRDTARLLVLDRGSGRTEHRVFSDLDQLLRPGDLLIANRTRVLSARLRGRRPETGGRVEALLLRPLGPRTWEALVRPGRRLQPGARILVGAGAGQTVLEVGERLAGGRRVVTAVEADLPASVLAELGEVPLPPYIQGWSGDPERYQTIYGDTLGSAAAPTAGLHFTPELFERLRERGVGLDFVTLHVGPDTFRPIRGETVKSHELHTEWAEVRPDTLTAIRTTRAAGGRVVAVGTTSVRALESAAAVGAGAGWSGWTGLYITPGHRFQNVDALVTNFHLPRSTLLVLVGTFAGRERVLNAYREAIARRYRFFSFGDAMLIT